jgi:dimethylamine monooxygenase subunit A
MVVCRTLGTRHTRGLASGSEAHVQLATLAATAVVFSFDALPEKLGQPVEFIHAPVPGFEKHLRKMLNLTFDRILKVEAPLWRNNWGISPSGQLDKPLYGSKEAHAHRLVPPTRERVRGMFLKVEYQTIWRLPKSGNLLFTVKTMADPLYSLEQVPAAAQCLAASIRGMSPTM